MRLDCDRAWMVGLSKTASGGAQVRTLAVYLAEIYSICCSATDTLSPS